MLRKGKHDSTGGGGKLSGIKIPKPVKIIIFIILAAVIIFFAFKSCKGKDADKNQNVQTSSSSVTVGNVEKTISGSGSLEPNERYEVIPLVNGEIISSPYDVGDYVEKGAMVYEFDTTDAKINLEKQKNSMQKSTITYNESLDQKDDLIITAPCSGIVQEVAVKAGDEINGGKQITQIINSRDLKVKLPFNETQVSGISAGDSAVITSSAAMSSISGTVSEVSDTPYPQSDGSSLYYVTIEFENPGAVSEGDTLGGSVNGIESPGSGEAVCMASETVSAKIAGTVTKVNYKEGDFVNQGDVLVTLSSTAVENSMKKSKLEYNDAKLSLENQQNQMDDYKVTAPISGTVLIKNSKAGDTIDRTNSSVTMMVIGDVSKLKFTLSIDELDIAMVAVGQRVNVTADAVEGKTFEGEITEIAMEGESSNGVTTYSAVVTVNDPQELKPSMNVDAVIVVESAENVLRVPGSDITTAMGKSFVFVKETEAEAKADKKNAKDSKKDDAKGSKGDKDSQRPSGDAPNGEPKDMKPQAPDGYKTVEVQTGVVGDEFTEIISGLSEGQEIYQKEVSSSSDSFMFGAPGGAPGGMGGGAMGGMGGAPGGGGGGNRGGMGGGPR